MVACLLAAVLAAAPAKLAVLQVAAGEGVPQSTAAALTEAVVGEVRRQSHAEVITQREISSILSLESQKAMLGCQTDACMAELGGALGADRLVAGDLARLGESLLLHLRLVDVKKQVEWIGAAGKTALTPLELQDSGPFVYGELGAYGSRLGTPCDGKFP